MKEQQHFVLRGKWSIHRAGAAWGTSPSREHTLTSWHTVDQLEKWECSGRAWFLATTLPSHGGLRWMSELSLKCFNTNGRSNTATCTCTAGFNSRAHGTSRANSFTKPHMKLPKKSARGHCAFFSLDLWPHHPEPVGTPVWAHSLISVYLARTQAMEFSSVLWACTRRADDTWPNRKPATTQGICKNGLNQQRELVLDQHALLCGCRVLDPLLTALKTVLWYHWGEDFAWTPLV